MFVDLTKPTHSCDSNVGVELPQHMSGTNADSSNTNAGSVFTTYATGISKSPSLLAQDNVL